MNTVFTFLSQVSCLFLFVGSKFSRNFVLSFVKKKLVLVSFPVVDTICLPFYYTVFLGCFSTRRPISI
jgi:hypothetical protein